MLDFQPDDGNNGVLNTPTAICKSCGYEGTKDYHGYCFQCACDKGLEAVNKDSMLHPGKLGQRMNKISKMVGFRVSCHMFRHTAGRLWAEAGVNQGIIARYLGHSDDKITLQYIHASAGKLVEINDEIKKNTHVFKPIKLRSRVKKEVVLA